MRRKLVRSDVHIRPALLCSQCIFPAEKATKKGGAANSAKDQEELDQVAGNAEDEIGDRIATIRESELLYGADSLLAIYGPMTVHICGSPHKFKVRSGKWPATCQLTS